MSLPRRTVAAFATALTIAAALAALPIVSARQPAANAGQASPGALRGHSWTSCPMGAGCALAVKHRLARSAAAR